MDKLSTTSCPVSRDLEFSIVVACYCEEGTIAEFHARLTESFDKLNRAYEVIYVNDGSTDNTKQLLEEIYAREHRPITLMSLYFNSGQAAAVTAGLLQCRGKNVILIDSDLQLMPEELSLLVEEYDKGFDLVSGYRVKRRDSWLRRVPSFFVNLLIRRHAAHPLRDFGCTMKIVDTEIIRAFDFGPFKPMRPAALMTLVENCSEVPVSHFPRDHGRSRWRFTRLVTYSLESIVGIGAHPWLLGALFGGSVTALALLIFLLDLFLLPGFLDNPSGAGALALLLLNLAITLSILALVIEFVVRKYTIRTFSPAYIIRTCDHKNYSETD